MTGERMALIDLIEKGADTDLMREMLAFAAERLMEHEMEGRTGVPAGARSPDRVNCRNGYRERGWETRAGRIDLAIPKLRNGRVSPATSAWSRVFARIRTTRMCARLSPRFAAGPCWA